MSMIEKLGITPIEEFTIAGRTSLFCLVEPVRNLEQQRNKLLSITELLLYWQDWPDEITERVFKVIQEIDPEHRTPDEIKELLS